MTGNGTSDAPGDLTGEVLREVRVGPPAHGGHAVARHDGRVVFVRHSAPGELVDVRLTDARPGARFWRADAVVIHEPSADRVPHVWAEAGPGGVGGAELGHLALPAQRAWKSEVLRDTLRRVGHLEVEGLTVVPAPGDDERGGLGTRTRVELVADGEGRAGMHRHRSHDVLPVTRLPLAVAHPLVAQTLERTWPPGARLEIVLPSGGEDAPDVDEPGGPGALLCDGEPILGRGTVAEHVTATMPDGVERTWSYRLAAAGFWQGHREAPRVLVTRVLAAAALQPGEHVLELYSGAGLLTLPLADAVGPDGSVMAVEGDADGARFARRNAHARDWIRLVHGDVARVLRAPAQSFAVSPRPDVVVLDPPRVGAGARVMAAVAALAPRRIVYVACDPAALARDAAHAVERGYVLSEIVGLDLFPHTHHIEAVAVLDSETRG